MTIPFSDDSLLPRPAPKMPVSPHGEQYTVRSERAAWEKRAAVVAEVAEELVRAKALLAGAARSNKLGDCIEGRTVARTVRSMLESFSADLTTQAARTASLATHCRSVAAEFEAADAESASELEA